MRIGLTNGIGGVLVGLEGLGVVALAVWQIVAIVQGNTDSMESAIALLVLTLVGAVAVLAFAVAIVRDRSWGRSGGIVVQLLILAVAFGAATGAYGHLAVGLELAVPAVLTLVVLALAARDAGRRARVSGEDA